MHNGTDNKTTSEELFSLSIGTSQPRRRRLS
jgi:hypothetical protein